MISQNPETIIMLGIGIYLAVNYLVWLVIDEKEKRQ